MLTLSILSNIEKEFFQKDPLESYLSFGSYQKIMRVKSKDDLIVTRVLKDESFTSFRTRYEGKNNK